MKCSANSLNESIDWKKSLILLVMTRAQLHVGCDSITQIVGLVSIQSRSVKSLVLEDRFRDVIWDRGQMPSDFGGDKNFFINKEKEKVIKKYLRDK